jgi:uncharacterized membrane protein
MKMVWISRKKLERTFDMERVQQAIKEAERETSGEIRVSVARHLFWGDTRRVAEKAFERMGMTATKERNGVLFFVAPVRRRFVVLGDTGIHERVGQEFWERVSAAMAEDFRRGDFTEGLVRGIREAGRELAVHFPCDRPRDVNELPDQIDFGGKEPEK